MAIYMQNINIGDSFSAAWLPAAIDWTLSTSCHSLTDDDNHRKQEWSSMESSSREIWDEIEMRFGHLVIGKAGQEIKW